MDEPIYFLSPEDLSDDDVIPRDAIYIIIGGTVKVVPHERFRESDLERLEIQEGVEEIGYYAFADCSDLTRIDFPSSFRKIGSYAFEWCMSLLEVNLSEGLQQIGMGAFRSCNALERITIPSSVVEIGNQAFDSCERLSEVILQEGLQRIGRGAFYGCSLLRRITIPSSVVEIEDQAFIRCDNLEEVTLAGGMVLVAQGAFEDCPQLERISISTMAIVVQAWDEGNGCVAAVTEGSWDPADEPASLILASPHLELMRTEELTNLKDAIEEISMTPEELRILTDTFNQTVDTTHEVDRDVSDRIRDCFIGHLSTWYRSYKREAATILELALWKIELERAREARHSRAAGGGKRARADIPARDDSRRRCGADPVVELVLTSLAGPHRRADQTEMQDRSSSGEERLLVPPSSPNSRGWRMRGASLLRTMLEMIGLRSSETPPS